MNNPEHDIDKLLTALRDAQAPPEIERRILQTLRDHSETQVTSSWRSLHWIAPRSWIMATAVAGTAAACLAVFAFHRLAQRPLGRSLAHVTSVDPSTTSLKLAANASHSLSAPPPITRANPRHSLALSSADSPASAEMHAPSHPAPPMPLTEQERLLLRIARSGTHQELATLSPEMRARLDADDAAAFRNFFEPARRQPKPGDNE